MASDEDEFATTDDARGDKETEGAGEQIAGLDGLLAQLAVVSEQLDDVAQEASDVIVQGSSAGGSVVVQLTAALEAVSIRIDPALVDPGDIGLLEDAVLAALRDALTQVVELQSELADELEGTEIDLSGLLGKLGGLASFGGLGLPDLGDLGNPEDLIAGLTGALGNLPASLGGSLPAGLSDMMAGLGLSNAAPAAPPSGDGAARAGEPGTTSESAKEPESTDDDRPES